MSKGYHRQILEFVNAELVETAGSVDGGTDLLAGGLIDSLGVMRLVDFLERDLGAAIPPADVTIENFVSVDRIVAYLETRGNA